MADKPKEVRIDLELLRRYAAQGEDSDGTVIKIHSDGRAYIRQDGLGKMICDSGAVNHGLRKLIKPSLKEQVVEFCDEYAKRQETLRWRCFRKAWELLQATVEHLPDSP